MYNQNITFNALDSYFLNTATGKINAGYLNDCIFQQLDIIWRNENAGGGKSRLHMALMNTRRKNHALLWEAFLEFANQAIADQYSGKYQASGEHLKKYLSKYGLSLEALDPALEAIDELRREYIAERKEDC